MKAAKALRCGPYSIFSLILLRETLHILGLNDVVHNAQCIWLQLHWALCDVSVANIAEHLLAVI